LLPHKECDGQGGRAARIEQLRAQDPSATSQRQVWRESEPSNTGTMGEGQGREEVSVASEIEEPHRTPEDILNE